MIPFNDFISEYQCIRGEIDVAVSNVLAGGWFILGNEVANFEAEFAEYIGAKFCVGVASGTDAITLSLMALGLGRGDEVITTNMTAFPTITGIINAGALPVVVDINLADGLIDPIAIEQSITPKTKAIVPVHLFGQSCEMKKIRQLADAHNLFIVEDCAQACGASYSEDKVGNIGDCGAFSFYPTKNLGAYGDGGAVVTNDQQLYTRLRLLRNYGQSSRYHHDVDGVNSRLDEIQAAILRVKLKYVDTWNDTRISIARHFREHLKRVDLLVQHPNNRHVYHLFVVKSPQREKLMEHLNAYDIQTLIHYPIPVHRQKAFRGRVGSELGNSEQFANLILSIPIHPWLKQTEIDQIVECINEFD
ncbi:MAG: DegT/DnrJ/EryC1/StrS family aminotransferase [Chloroflexi bacterium]|nr:DegT/DnrJ/EryC1/StrS family aminotransferase [Chloroflexota bacterium]